MQVKHTNVSMPTVQLNNGVSMPQLGLGVWQAKDGNEVEGAVKCALESGYRLIDTAAVYGNEKGVGNGILSSGVSRKDIFITTKLWNADQGYANAKKAFKKSLKRLGLDYIDLFLIHWPMPQVNKYIETWQALEELQAEGLVVSIGVSNFNDKQLSRLIEESHIKPVINQVELHPHFQQKALREFCHQQTIQIESWSPLGGGKGGLLTNPSLQTIGKKYNKSSAQVIIRWHLQNGLVVIPKSTHPERIKQNIDILNFELNKQDMLKINDLDTNTRVGANPDHMNTSVKTGIVQLAHKFGLVHW